MIRVHEPNPDKKNMKSSRNDLIFANETKRILISGELTNANLYRKNYSLRLKHTYLKLTPFTVK